jgi:hypothetical protein
MRRELEQLFRAYLGDMRLVEAGYLRRPVIEHMVASHVAGRSDHGNRLWLLLNAEVWYRLHVEGEPLDQAQAYTRSALGERQGAPAVLAATA